MDTTLAPLSELTTPASPKPTVFPEMVFTSPRKPTKELSHKSESATSVQTSDTPKRGKLLRPGPGSSSSSASSSSSSSSSSSNSSSDSENSGSDKDSDSDNDSTSSASSSSRDSDSDSDSDRQTSPAKRLHSSQGENPKRRRLQFDDHSKGPKSAKSPSAAKPQNRIILPLTERQQMALVAKQQEQQQQQQLLPSIHKRNANGETPLHVATIKGKLATVQNLLSQGASVNTKDNASWTPLHEACNFGFFDMAELLIRHGADVNAEGGDKDTPLHDACVNGHFEVVKLLIENGAIVNKPNARRVTPLDVAATPEISTLLIAHGAEDPYSQTTEASAPSRVYEPPTASKWKPNKSSNKKPSQEAKPAEEPKHETKNESHAPPTAVRESRPLIENKASSKSEMDHGAVVSKPVVKPEAKLEVKVALKTESEPKTSPKADSKPLEHKSPAEPKHSSPKAETKPGQPAPLKSILPQKKVEAEQPKPVSQVPAPQVSPKPPSIVPSSALVAALSNTKVSGRPRIVARPAKPDVKPEAKPDVKPEVKAEPSPQLVLPLPASSPAVTSAVNTVEHNAALLPVSSSVPIASNPDVLRSPPTKSEPLPTIASSIIVEVQASAPVLQCSTACDEIAPLATQPSVADAVCLQAPVTLPRLVSMNLMKSLFNSHSVAPVADAREISEPSTKRSPVGHSKTRMRTEPEYSVDSGRSAYLPKKLTTRLPPQKLMVDYMQDLLRRKDGVTLPPFYKDYSIVTHNFGVNAVKQALASFAPAVPPTLSEAKVPLFTRQERERLVMQERMHVEADHIRVCFEREMVRACRAYDMYNQGLANEARLTSEMRFVFTDTRPDLIGTFHQIRKTFHGVAQEATDRHFLESQAFAAIQCLAWDSLDCERFVPVVSVPDIVLEVMPESY